MFINLPLLDNCHYFELSHKTINMLNPKQKPNFFSVNIKEHRKKVSNLKARLPHAKTPFKDYRININSEFEAKIRIYRSENGLEKYKTVFYIPGTAFVARERDITNMICSHISSMTGVQVIILEHRLAPEVRLPFQLEDLTNLIRILLDEKHDSFCIDKNNLVLSGYSSGANFSAILSLLKPNLFRSQILLSPMLDLSRSLKKYNEFEEQDSAIKSEFVNWFLNLALPEDETGKLKYTPIISPFWAKKSKLAKLPKTTIFVGEFDRFRSDSECFREKLLLSGHRDNSILRIKNSNHGFLWNNFEAIQLFSCIIADHINILLVLPKQINIKCNSNNQEYCSADDNVHKKLLN